MSDLFRMTLDDLHCGRMTWRVKLLLGLVASSVSMVAGFVH